MATNFIHRLYRPYRVTERWTEKLVFIAMVRDNGILCFGGKFTTNDVEPSRKKC